MPKFEPIHSRVAPLLTNDIDTDQIIPARFLKATDKAGLGAHLFADWRYAADGSPIRDFVLNREEYRGCRILLAGSNFGCGSSREHAPWALRDFGFRAVISESFADIFRNNALKNGLLPVQLPAEVQRDMAVKAAGTGGLELTVDLESQTVQTGDGGRFHFPIDDFSKYCLLNDVDELGYILRYEEKIAAYEKTNT